MGHPLCYVPPDESGWRVVEVTARTHRGAFLLRPSAQLCDRVIGILGRAQRATEVRIYQFTYLSNHLHMLLGVRDGQQCAAFMQRVQAQTSVELRHLVSWRGPVWQGRYKRTVLSHEAANLTRRMRYLLAQGCKEGLVDSPLDWPGPSSSRSLCAADFELTGSWIDRTRMCRAPKHQLGAMSPAEDDFREAETVHLSKLPGFDHLSDEAYATWVKSLVEDIEQATAAMHRAAGTRPMGVTRALRARPHHVPRRVAWGPRPRVVASSRRERERLMEALSMVVGAYRRACKKRDGTDGAVKFPEGTFPSARRFVPSRDGPMA